MKALVYQGPGKKVLEERPKPEVAAPTDAIVKIVKDDDLRDGSSHS
jgi:alcohol dehydrogenase